MSWARSSPDELVTMSLRRSLYCWSLWGWFGEDSMADNAAVTFCEAILGVRLGEEGDWEV